MTIDLAELLERLVRVSTQRWLLAGAAVAAASTASIVAGLSGGGTPPILLIIVGALAVVSAARPDTHTALVVIVTVIWQWLAMSDDPTGPAALAVALALFVFHSTIALMAAGPVTTQLDLPILRQWFARVLTVSIATIGTWVLVLLMEQRRADGNSAVTIGGLVVALALAGALLHRVRRRDNLGN